ncbi:hypothetical protein AN958_07167 [Leucoagaricus sp. SymC.cos]|nr:hypothetical protein AN958_07167 [Leucoagaricus sp. SymC.cos]
MFSTFLTVTLFFTFAINAVFADFAVSTPEVQACKGQEVTVSWEPAKAPYSLIVVAADDPCGDALVDAGDFQKTIATFKVDQLKAGQKVQVSVEDADGNEGWSDVINVKECSAASSSSSASALASALASASSPSSASSSASAAVVDGVTGTTLVVTPTYSAGDSSATSSGSVDPVGAANAANPFGSNSNAAAIPRHLSISALTLTVIGGVIALLL